MARSKGSANFAGSLEVLAGAPIDARSVVPTKADLTVSSNFPYFYEGMPVYCKDEKKIYVLTGSSVTVAANWVAVGGDGKTEIQWGYLDSNVFYEESTHVTVIPAETDTVYVERNTKKIYEYDGTDYVELSDGIDTVVYQPGGSYAFASLPAPAAGTLGFVYDVTDDFTTTSDFRDGSGIDYPAGTNVAVVNTGTSLSPVYKYDVLMGNLSGYQKKIQYAALPTASVDYVGKVFQYIGTTTATFTNGFWYECVEDSGAYQWVKKDVDHEPLTNTQMQAVKDAFAVSQPVQFAANPVGCIIQMMGVTAPAGYLACDGTVYNISAYPVLAGYFANQFGSSNNFGGDGITTFAVPDLRGEFLRGTGTNSHTNQGNGAAVGTHQDATKHVYFSYDGGGHLTWMSDYDKTKSPSFCDKIINGASSKPVIDNRTNNTDVQTRAEFYHARPTNTSVLYCIKY